MTTTQTLHIDFTNDTGLATGTSISIGFLQGPPTTGMPATPFSINNSKDNSAILNLNDVSGNFDNGVEGNWYTLDQLSDGVDITSFSGRIYVCYGEAWKLYGAAYEPGQALTDQNFYLRYDKLEMTYTGAASDVANLTSIDYWSIPISLRGKQGSTVISQAKGLRSGVTTKNYYQALKAVTTPPVSGLPGVTGTAAYDKPLPAVVPGDFTQYPGGPAPGTSFARVIGPSSYPAIDPQGIPVQPYGTLKAYLQYLYSTTPNDIATIKGEFAGVGPHVPATGPKSKQSYDYTASISATLDITLTESSGSNTLLYKCEDLLNPAGLYGGNAPFYFNGATTKTTPANDVYGWITADLLAGINIGAVGSTTVVDDPVTNKSVQIGDMPSSHWFELSDQYRFSAISPGTGYFNQWAATVAVNSEAYNFAYTDRFARVFVGLNPADVDTLEIVLESAAVE